MVTLIGLQRTKFQCYLPYFTIVLTMILIALDLNQPYLVQHLFQNLQWELNWLVSSHSTFA